MLIKKTNKQKFLKWRIDRAKIKDIVKIAYIVAINLVIIQYHISIPSHGGIEIEKFDLSMLVSFLCIGIVKLKIIVWSSILVPLIDNLIHGHGLLWTPFEILSNALIVVLAYFFLKNHNGKFLDIISKFFLLIFIVGLRYIIHAIGVSIIFRRNLIGILTGKAGENVDVNAVVIWPLILINVVKFSIIIFLTGIIKIRRNYEKRNTNY